MNKGMNIRKMTSQDLSGKRVLIREDLNVPIKDGVGDQRCEDSRRVAHHPGRPDGQGPRHADVPSGASGGGQVRRGIFARPGREAPHAATRRAGGAQARLARRRRRGAGRSGAPRKRPLQQGREEELRRTREENGGALRHLRHGRVRYRAPRGGEHPRRREVRADRLRRAAAGQ